MSDEEIASIREKYSQLSDYRSSNLDEPIDPLTFVDPTGDGLLHIATRAGDMTTVALLLRAGADVDQTGDMRCTALHYAKMKSHEDIYALLVDNGASTLIRNEFGLLPNEAKLP